VKNKFPSQHTSLIKKYGGYMMYPPSMKLAVYGLPADIVGAFSVSYLDMNKASGKWNTKYQIVHSKIEGTPLQVEIYNFNARPLEDESIKELLLKDFPGHIIVYKNTHKEVVIHSEIFKEVEKRKIPHMIIEIDGDKRDSDVIEFDFFKILKWLIEESYTFQFNKRPILTKQKIVITHEEFVKFAPKIYNIIKKHEKNYELLMKILREINVKNAEFQTLPDSKQINETLKNNLDRFTYLKLVDAVDRIRDVEERYKAHLVSKEHFLAVANHQVKRIIDNLLSYI